MSQKMPNTECLREMGKYNFESKQKLLSSVNHASNVKKKKLNDFRFII